LTEYVKPAVTHLEQSQSNCGEVGVDFVPPNVPELEVEGFQDRNQAAQFLIDFGKKLP
jgi:hypothetical protein